MILPQEYQRPNIIETWTNAGMPSFSAWARKVSDVLTRQYDRPVTVTNRTLLGRVQRELKNMGTTISDYRYDIMQTRKPRRAAPRKPDPIHLKAAVFDIETTDLDASGYEGHLLVTCILEMDASEPTVYAIKHEDRGNDYNLLQAVVAGLSRYNFLIGHNIAAFDFNWITSRLMYHGLQMPPAWMYFDTYQVAKNLSIKAGRKSLAFLGDFFRIDADDNEKTAIYPQAWSQARSPNRDEFDAMIADCVDHCIKDVKRNRDLFNCIYPYAMGLGNSAPWKLTKWRGI